MLEDLEDWKNSLIETEPVKIGKWIGYKIISGRQRTYYHITSRLNLPSIMRKGLIPTRPQEYTLGDEEGYVMYPELVLFLAYTPGDAISLAIEDPEAIGEAILDFPQPVILEVTVPDNIVLYDDPEGYGGSVMTMQLISPQYIRVIEMRELSEEDLEDLKKFTPIL